MPRGIKIDRAIRDQVRELKGLGYLNRQIATKLNMGAKAVGKVLNPETREKARDKRRQMKALHVHTTINGVNKQYRVDGRRPKPEACELCGKLCNEETSRNGLGWHHWDNDHLEWGLWLCTICHMMANEIEKGKVKKYLELRKWAMTCTGVLMRLETLAVANVN